MAKKGSENSAPEDRENQIIQWLEWGARKDFLLGILINPLRPTPKRIRVIGGIRSLAASGAPSRKRVPVARIESR